MSDQHTIPQKRPGIQTFLRVLPRSGALDSDVELKAAFKKASDPELLKKQEVWWRIVLTPIDSQGDPIALELYGDVVFGTGSKLAPGPDIDLADWEGEKYGVSHRHMMLRPTHKSLFVMDLQSTNGTHVNGTMLSINQARTLEDGDLISLGQLHFRLKILDRD